MARQRKLSPKRKAFINSLLEHYQPTDANDVQEMLKDLYGRKICWEHSSVISYCTAVLCCRE